MKSLIFLSSLLLLASCGKEQFGTVAQSESTRTSGVEKYSATFETKRTLLKPKVDILYVVDNSESTTHIQQDLKNSVANTIKTISGEFDYRVISTPLLSTSTSDYNVFTNSSDPLPSTSAIVPSTDLLLNPIFANLQGGTEKGLGRTIDFMNHHKNTGLLRKKAYHLIILVSNGRDEEVEETLGTLSGETKLRTVIENGNTVTVFSQRLAGLNQLKTSLESQDLRLFSVTASRPCKSGWRSSKLSYQEMSKSLHGTSDIYDLCGTGFSTLFSGVNSSIKEVEVPHKYRYFPITFADDNSIVDTEAIRVQKVSNGSITNLTRGTDWTYEHFAQGQSKPMREDPEGEHVTSKHFIRLNQLLVYPDNILITSTSMVEYFQYVVIPRPAKKDLIVRVNGQDIPAASIVYEGFKANTNIKVAHQGSSATPEVIKTGFFIKITNPSYFYKSGDTVDVYYTPDAI